jgi:hypothetical protein
VAAQHLFNLKKAAQMILMGDAIHNGWHAKFLA